jgi:hypothetical protein
MLGMERQNGPAPDIHVEAIDGKSHAVSATGATRNVRPKVERSEDGKSFNIQARDLPEMKRLLHQIRQKFPTMDSEAVLAKAEFSSQPVDSVMKKGFEFGGDLAERSTVKSAMAFAFSLGVLPEQCGSAIKYLRRDEAVEPSLAAYFASEIVLSRPSGIFNCVAVFGNAKIGRLLGYVEYFGVCRWIVHLSDCYNGPDIQGVYGFDVITGKDIALEVELDISDQNYQRSLKNCSADGAKRIEVFEATMPVVLARRNELARSALIDYAIAGALTAMNLKPDSPLNKDQLHEFEGRVSRLLADDLVKRNTGRKEPTAKSRRDAESRKP